jgi:hypothetical protein
MDPGDAQINEAIAKAWADECGGQLAIELNQERKALSQGVRPPFDRERFEATSRLFKEAGLSEEEHLVYRSTALLDRCEKTLWKLISDINPDWHLDEDERGGLARHQFIEPRIDRRQLEVETTKYTSESLCRSKMQPEMTGGRSANGCKILTIGTKKTQKQSKGKSRKEEERGICRRLLSKRLKRLDSQTKRLWISFFLEIPQRHP